MNQKELDFRKQLVREEFPVGSLVCIAPTAIPREDLSAGYYFVREEDLGTFHSAHLEPCFRIRLNKNQDWFQEGFTWEGGRAWINPNKLKEEEVLKFRTNTYPLTSDIFQATGIVLDKDLVVYDQRKYRTNETNLHRWSNGESHTIFVPILLGDKVWNVRCNHLRAIG